MSTLVKKPKISIIVSVYNIEDYIIECLDSIERQTFKDFEVIVVNDGSQDSSSKLVSEYIENNDLTNYILINQSNGGVSSARNRGLREASGEWIAFIDGDDWVEEHYLSDMVDALEEHDADLVIVGYHAYDMVSKTYIPRSDYKKDLGYIPQDLKHLQSFGYIWSRLYKKEIIDKNNIKFDERIAYCEDNAFNFDYNCFTGSFYQINRVGYNYRINRGSSLTQKLIHPKVKYHLYEHLERFYEKWGDELLSALSENIKLSWALWNVASAAVANDILDKKYSSARAKMNGALLSAVVDTYVPRNQKDMLFKLLWKTSFPVFALVTRLYYNNFERLRKSKLLKRFSQNH